LICAIHDRLHQLASDAEILRAGIDGNRTDAGDTGTLVETIAADDAAAAFRDDAIKAGTGKQHRKQAHSGFRSRQITREAVLGAERGEGVVANLSADRTVDRSRGTNDDLRL